MFEAKEDISHVLQTTDHHRLLIKVARLYYEQGLTHAEIAERLRLVPAKGPTPGSASPNEPR